MSSHAQLRNRFLEKLDNDVDEFDPEDVNRVKTDDDYLQRFIRHNEGNVDNAFKMLWETCQWRKKTEVNSIEESNVNRTILESGSLFPYGKDKDGNSMLIFRAKMHSKSAHSVTDQRRCLIYWLERMERQENGRKMSLFFDMSEASVGNVDLDYTTFLIGLFKNYYPDFLNYILIFQMTWTLTATFQIIKGLLPEKAVQKLKFINKSKILDFVHPDCLLVSWGGTKHYDFHFEPEERVRGAAKNSEVIRKSTRFQNVNALSDTSRDFDTSEVSERSFKADQPEENANKMHLGTTLTDSGDDKDSPAGDEKKTTPANKPRLEIFPENIVVFTLGVNGVASHILLKNMDSQCISFKIKTTSPEKFHVHPGVGVLGPNGNATIKINLLSRRSLERDKFLIMSTTVDRADISTAEINDLWKGMTEARVERHKLICGILQMPHGYDSKENHKRIHEMKGNGSISPEQLLDKLSLITDVDQGMRGLRTCTEDLKEELRVVRRLLYFCLVFLIGFLSYHFYGSWRSPHYSQCYWAESRDG